MRVLICGINYRPELTAVGPYTAGLAEHMARRGDQVTVVTGVPHYPGWRIRRGARRSLWAMELIDGVEVIRAAHYVPARQTALRRAAYEATFGFTGLLAALTRSHPDVVLGVVPSLSGGLIARIAAERFSTPYGVLFQDVMGPASRQSGVSGGHRVANLTTAVERWAVGRAAAVAVVTDAFVPYLEGLGVARAAIHRVPNWSRSAAPTSSVNEIRDRFGWDDGRTVALHAGNMGHKQGLEQVLAAARLAAVRGDPVRFVLAGGGNRAGALREAAANLANVEFIGVQPDGIHASLLAAADVLLLSERAEQLDMSLPSKLTSYFVAGRPIVAAVPGGGASANEVERSGAGFIVPVGHPQALLDALLALRRDQAWAGRMGARGPAFAAAHTSRAACLDAAAGFVDAIAGREATRWEAAA